VGKLLPHQRVGSLLDWSNVARARRSRRIGVTAAAAIQGCKSSSYREEDKKFFHTVIIIRGF